MNIENVLSVANTTSSPINGVDLIKRDQTFDNLFNGTLNMKNTKFDLDKLNTDKVLDKRELKKRKPDAELTVKENKTNDTKKLSKTSKSETKVNNIKNDKDTKIEKFEETNIEDEKSNKDDAIEKEVCVFAAVLNALNNTNLENAVIVNEDDSMKIDTTKLDVNDLNEKVLDYLNNNLDNFNEENTFEVKDFEVDIKSAISVIENNANEKIMQNKKEENFTKLFYGETISDGIKDALIENSEDLGVYNAGDEDIIALSNNEDKNLEVLKDTINEMIDTVTIEQDEKKDVKDILNEFNKNKNDLGTKEIKKELDVENDNNETINSINLEAQNNIEENKENSANENNDENKDEKSVKLHQRKENTKTTSNVRNIFDINEENIFDAKTNTLNKDSFFEIKDEGFRKTNITEKYLETLHVTKQMIKGINLKISETSSEMQIKLDPENLGKVSLKLATENGLIVAKFEAESQKVKEILESNLSLLKETLEERGMEVGNLEVSVGQNMNNSNNDNIEYMRKMISGKNPHKNFIKGINNFGLSAEIENSDKKIRGLYMTKSQVNYIA